MYMLNNTMMTAEILSTIRGTVARAIGHTQPGAVDDVVGAAVLKVLEGLSTFDPAKGEFKGWACRIARNEAINHVKRACNHGHDSETSADEDGDASPLVDTLIGEDGRTSALRIEQAEWLAMALATLSDDERTFIRAINQDMGQTEAGALVGWSPATATRRRREIAAKMRAL
jgi:RNA polymerase sigma factor (sigma-70 family)